MIRESAQKWQIGGARVWTQAFEWEAKALTNELPCHNFYSLTFIFHVFSVLGFIIFLYVYYYM